MYLAYCDETLHVSGRIKEMKYVNVVFQTIYNQLGLTQICSDCIQIKILPY